MVEGRKLILGGVEIPFEKGLLGHSDADVLTHAIIDALLGAAGLGDIGRLFPDTDAANKNADSIGLLEEVVRRIEQDRLRVSHVDATVVCERPKIKPLRGRRCIARLAEAMHIPAAKTSPIKATTTEGMNDEGRKAFASPPGAIASLI